MSDMRRSYANVGLTSQILWFAAYTFHSFERVNGIKHIFFRCFSKRNCLSFYSMHFAVKYIISLSYLAVYSTSINMEKADDNI